MKYAGKLNLLKKMQKLSVILDERDWYDDAKHFQGWKYMTGHQFIKHFRKSCIEVGLIFRAEVINSEYIDILKTLSMGSNPKFMNMFRVEMLYELIDPDTGEYFSYVSTGVGVDNMDKAENKAKTFALKYFIRDNFLVGETPEGDEIDEDGNESKFTIKKEAKKKLMSKPSKSQLKVIKAQMKELTELDPEEKEYIKKLLEETNNFKNIDSKGAEKIILELKEKIDEKEGE
ncbi:MAG: hypothetical protein ACOCQD_02345 [archaeon]